MIGVARDIDSVDHPKPGDPVLLESGELVSVDHLSGFIWPVAEPIPARFYIVDDGGTERPIIPTGLDRGLVTWREERRTS